MNTLAEPMNREKVVRVLSGWLMLPVVLICFFGGIALLIYSLVAGIREMGHPIWVLFVTALLLEILSFLLLPGFFTLQPNEARVLILFGDYHGTVRAPGFHWGNPFYSNGPTQIGTSGGIEFQSNRGAGKPSARKRLTRFKL